MSAVSESSRSVSATPSVSARAAAIALLAVAIAFAAAFAVGSMSKTTSRTVPAGQLAPVSPLQGHSSAQISVPSAAGSIPALAQVAKPKPAHHAKAATQSPASTTSAQITSTPTQSTAVTQQPVQQSVQQPVQQPVQRPVQHPTQPQQPVVVVHGG